MLHVGILCGYDDLVLSKWLGVGPNLSQKNTIRTSNRQALLASSLASAASPPAASSMAST
jgi:hypothetical protein